MMLNQIVVVGRIKNKVLLEKDDEKEKMVITVEVKQPVGEEECNTYEIDFVLWNMLANSMDRCEVGSVVGVKGIAETKEIDGERKTTLTAHKITFLATEDNNNENNNTNRE